ncbi:sulfatase-like hydrolase/transferase [Lacibacter sp. H407]|uniref:sulfatase-like hydrolase/transferase n=1 Tax=Lacibacter sp. H407 TaxID=3133423 RepID=UPI0030BC7330
MLVVLVCAFVLCFISFKLFRNFKKAAISTFIISLCCLAFGYLHDSLKQLLPQSYVSKFIVVIPATFLLFLIIFLILKKRKRTFDDAYLFLNLLFTILILSEIPNSIKRYQIDKSVDNLIDFRFNVFNDYQPSKTLPDSLKPDIYFLVFDALASSKSMQQNFKKNTYQLDSHLLKKGFYVVTNGAANYNWTIHSLTSTFNMEYLPPWIAPVMNDPKVYFWGSSSILNNSLFQILKKEKYNIHNYQPISFDNEDWPGDSYFLNMRQHHYSFKTLPGRIYRDIFWNYNRIDVPFIKNRQFKIIDKRNADKKNYFDTTISMIKNSCSLTGKQKFVYGHFMLPHDPYIFDSTGKVKTAEKTILKVGPGNSDSYYHQVVYAGKIIRELTNYIQLHNKKNTIIIIEGDHGFRSQEGDKEGYTFQNFNSIYFPDQNYELLYDSLSPVNTFRIVLNKYFGANLNLLKDSSTLVTAQKETVIKSEKIQLNKIN